MSKFVAIWPDCVSICSPALASTITVCFTWLDIQLGVYGYRKRSGNPDVIHLISIETRGAERYAVCSGRERLDAIGTRGVSGGLDGLRSALTFSFDVYLRNYGAALIRDRTCDCSVAGLREGRARQQKRHAH